MTRTGNGPRRLRSTPPLNRPTLVIGLAFTMIIASFESPGHGALFADDATTPSSEGLSVKLEVAKGPYFVGQGIALTLGSIGEADRPKVDPPKLTGAELWPVNNDVKPLSTSGIGQTISQENLFLNRFRLLPRKAGSVDIPPFVVQANGRTGRTRPMKLEVGNPPLTGRPASFLGGIGAFSIKALAEPSTLRVGQEFEFRIRIEGPAAWGSQSSPDLERFSKLPLDLRITPTRQDPIREPPSRDFVYQLRPTRPGEVTLPPVLVSSFDIKTGRYETKASSGVPIRVIAVADFDPTSVAYTPIAESSDNFEKSRWPLIAGFALLAIACGAAAWYLRRSRQTRTGPELARRFAQKTVDMLSANPGKDPIETANLVNGALVEYLERGQGRPAGALTPSEANLGVTELTGSIDLGRLAEEIVTICDQTLYDSPQIARVTPPRPLHEEAVRLFRSIAERSVEPSA